MPDGRLALCCNDYSPKWNIGNIIYESREAVSRSDGIRSFLDGLDRDNGSVCWKCTSAIERDNAVKEKYPDWYVYGDNFWRVRNAFDCGTRHPILDLLRKAKHICIYGLGKFFKDSYFASWWSTLLRADIFSDGNESLYGKKIMGIPVVPKADLVKYENLLVVIYVRNDKDIREDLSKLGVKNCVNISEIMEIKK